MRSRTTKATTEMKRAQQPLSRRIPRKDSEEQEEITAAAPESSLQVVLLLLAPLGFDYKT